VSIAECWWAKTIAHILPLCGLGIEAQASHHGAATMALLKGIVGGEVRRYNGV